MDRHRGGGGDLNERLAWRIGGPLDRNALQRALDELVTRHEALRTTFAGAGRRLEQRVHEPAPVALAEHELPAATGEDELAAILAARAEERIDTAGPPLRAHLWRLAADDHVLLLALHHLVTDGRSNAIISAQLGALYDAAASAGAAHLPPTGWQYADWAMWQHRRLEGSALQASREHWRAALAGTQSPRLPDRSAHVTAAPGTKGYERRRVQRRTARALAGVAAAHGTTRRALALAAFVIALRGVTGQDDLAVASLFDNRERPEVEHSVGFFVNMLLLRGRASADLPFADLLAEIEGTIGAARAHADLPLQLLPPGLVQTPPGGRVEDVLFQFVDGEPRPGALARMARLRVTPIERQSDRSRFALELFVAWSGDELAPVLLVDRGRFDEVWSRRFADDYIALLERLAAGPDATIDELLAACAAPA
jgi:hypothetical protein